MNSKKSNTKKTLAVSFLLIILLGFIATHRSRLEAGHPEIYFKQNMLQSLWYHYKQDYMEQGTLRVLDKSKNNITTSESESYAMLRSVWMNDKVTFDASWGWTKNNLEHKNDHLFSWLFGERSDGTYGILTTLGGNHTATDADSDIALALLFASHRWNDDSYRFQAKEIIQDIWTYEVATIKSKPYLLANNKEKTDLTKNTYIINPSYLSPYAYRMFATIDPTHDWLGLVDTSYEILKASSEMPLDRNSSAGLPPDWIEINKKTAELKASSLEGLTTNFSYDALRTPWRIELDKEWFGDERASTYLDSLSFLAKAENVNGKLISNYAHDGVAIETRESPAMYGGTIAYFIQKNPDLAHDLYLHNLESLYNPDTLNWTRELGYYDANWAWFGIALYNHALPNLFVSPKT
ncbi:hypothetical protein BH11PAT3_BH11PAT3_2080 [soil metagenome]